MESPSYPAEVEALTTLDEDELADGYGIVVDWRACEDDVVHAFGQHLARGDSLVGNLDDLELFVTYNGAEYQVPLTQSPADRYVTICSLASILSPKYELRRERASSKGDTHVFLLLLAEDWRRLEAGHGAWADLFEPVPLGEDGFNGGAVPYVKVPPGKGRKPVDPAAAQRKAFAKARKNWREWLDRDGRDGSEESRTSILEELAKPKPNLRVIAGRVERVSPRMYFEGGLKVLEGDPAGWPILVKAIAYDYSAIRIHVPKEQFGRPPGNAIQTADRAVLLLASSVALELDGIANWLGARLARSLGDHAFGDWTGLPFPVFSLALWASLRGKSVIAPETAIAALGPYEKLLDPDATDAEWQAAVLGACDYHREQTKSRSSAPRGGSFHEQPYGVWPVEVQAWQRWARSRGRTPPAVDHALLESPFMKLPSRDLLALPDDDLLIAVELEAEKQEEW
jgi:hypothetical protein